MIATFLRRCAAPLMIALLLALTFLSFAQSVAGACTVTITSVTPPAGQVGASYSTQLAAIGCNGSYQWSLVGGALPLGLNVSSAGVVSGTPALLGLYFVTVQAKDSSGAIATAGIVFSIAPAQAGLVASPGSLAFSGQQGGSNPPTQLISVSSNVKTTFNATSDSGWLSASPTSGSTPNGLTVTAAVGTLTAGTYSGKLTITPTSPAGPAQTVSVTFTISPPPVLSVSPSSLSFAAVAGGSNPASQSVQINNNGGGTLSFTDSKSQSWLIVSPSSGAAPATLTAGVNITGLQAGTYTDSIQVSAAGAQNSPQTVSVTLTISASPVLSVSPSSLSFSAAAGGSNPASQSVQITNPGTGTLSFTDSKSQSWLTVSPSSGSAPATLTVSVKIAGLQAGTYTDSIQVSAAGAQNSPQTVPVTLTISGPPALSVSPSSLSFAAVAGGSNPASQSIQITNTGAGTLSFTDSKSQSWLTVSPSSGSTPGTLTASVNITGLPAGTYTDSIQVSAAGAPNSPQTVSVTLTISTRSRGPILSVSGLSLSFSAQGGGSSPNSQSVQITNIGTGTLFFTASQSQSWLIVYPPSGSAPATLTAGINVNGLKPGTYTDSITVTGQGAQNSPQTISVTLSVTGPPTSEATGNVVVHTANGISNGAPFTVSSGSIGCVSPGGTDTNPGAFAGGCFATLIKARNTTQRGDITISQSGNGAAPPALVVHPGAKVTIGVPANPNGTGVFAGDQTRHRVFTGLQVRGTPSGFASDVLIGASTDFRLVGNELHCPLGSGNLAEASRKHV